MKILDEGRDVRLELVVDKVESLDRISFDAIVAVEYILHEQNMDKIKLVGKTLPKVSALDVAKRLGAYTIKCKGRIVEVCDNYVVFEEY
jgi:hypothetical protein